MAKPKTETLQRWVEVTFAIATSLSPSQRKILGSLDYLWEFNPLSLINQK
jgi:hypothetical protein